MTRYHVLVLAPKEGVWHTHFPDFPECSSEGSHVEVAIVAATSLATRAIQSLRLQHLPVPEPRSFEDIRADAAWTTMRAIDWSKAIVTLVPPAAGLRRRSAPLPHTAL